MRSEHGRESLDAAIDLEVERMVAGPAEGRVFDPATLGPRRLDGTPWRAPLALAASVAVAVSVAVLLWSRPPATSEFVVLPTLTARVPFAVASPLQPAVKPATWEADVPARHLRASRAASHEVTIRPSVEVAVDSVSAEGGPLPLSVAELQSAPMELPALAVGALNIADIRIQPLVVPSVEMKE